MQAIEAALKDRNQFFLLDQDPGDLPAAYWALRQGVSCRERASTRACCNRGARAEFPVILRRRANYMNRRRQAALRTPRRASKP